MEEEPSASMVERLGERGGIHPKKLRYNRDTWTNRHIDIDIDIEIHKHKQHKRIGIYHCRLDKAANRNWLMAIKSIPDSDRFV